MANPVIRGAVQAGANATTAASTRAPGVPAGTQTGDLLILAMCWSGSTVTLTNPTGWTLQHKTAQTNDNLAVFTRTADGSATDSPTLTLSSAVTCIATCMSLGAWTGTPVSANVLGGSATTTVTYPAITPATAADLLVYITGLRPTTASTQVTAPAPAGGTGGAVTKQIDGCTNVTGSAESQQAFFTQYLSSAAAIAQQTATASTTVSADCEAICVSPGAAAVTAASRPVVVGQAVQRAAVR